jgi:hypothetical protein
VESFAAMPSLMLLSADGQSVEREVSLAEAEVTIGRDRECVLMLADEKVSRRHARVVPSQEGWVLRDEGSANGVWLGSERVVEHRLTTGDVFRIGRHEIAFTDGDAATLLAARQRRRGRVSTGARAGSKPREAAGPRPGFPAWAAAVGLLAVLGGTGAAAVYLSRSLWLPLLAPRVPAEKPGAVVPRSTLPPPGVAEFGLFAQTRELRTIALSPEAREHALGDTVRLLVPAGTVAEVLPFDATVFELELQQLSTLVHSARVYVLEAAEGTRIAKPLVLEIAWPSAKTSVREHTAGGWQALAVPEGPSTRVTIDHLSRRTIAVVEWDQVPSRATVRAGGMGRTKARPGAPTGTPLWPLPAGRSRLDDDASYQGFIGAVPARYQSGREEFCAELVDRVLDYPNVSFARPLLRGEALPQPRRGLPSGDPFAALLVTDLAPSELGRNIYVRVTTEPPGDGDRRSPEQRLEQAILDSGGELRPADVLALSLRACDGNYPLAVLTSHNLLKELAHLGNEQARVVREAFAGGREAAFPRRPGELAERLVNLRAAAGDKMGLWYHAFVPLAVAAWTGNSDEADSAITKDYALRFLASLAGADTPPDAELQASGRCFARAARTIEARKAEAEQKAATPAPGTRIATGPAKPRSLAGEALLKLTPFEPVLLSADEGYSPDLQADLERSMCIPGFHAGAPRIRIARDGAFAQDCALERSEPGDKAKTRGRMTGRIEPATGEPAFSGGCTQQHEFTLAVGGAAHTATSTTAYRSVVRRVERDQRGRPSSVHGKLRYDHQLTTENGTVQHYTAEVPFEMTFRWE